MAYERTEIQQGSAKDFRDNINQNFEDIEKELSYDPGGEQPAISIQTAIDNIHTELDGPNGVKASIIEVATDLSDYASATDATISILETGVSNLNTRTESLETVVGDSDSGLVKQFNDLNKIDLYDPSQVTGRTIKFYLTELRDDLQD